MPMVALTAARDPQDRVIQSTAEFAVSDFDTDENGYAEYPGAPWSPHLGNSPFGAGNDAHRLKVAPQHDFRPHGSDDTPSEFYENRDADTDRRHRAEKIGPTEWETHRAGSGRPTAPDPRLNPPRESRITSALQNMFQFTRPFDQTPARQFNGSHFSMADHRREYEVLGMEPVRSGRNTYRTDPVPWDENIVDVAPNEPGNAAPYARSVGAEVPLRGGSFRLV